MYRVSRAVAASLCCEPEEMGETGTVNDPHSVPPVFRDWPALDDDAIVAAVHSAQEASFHSSAAERGFQNKSSHSETYRGEHEVILDNALR